MRITISPIQIKKVEIYTNSKTKLRIKKINISLGFNKGFAKGLIFENPYNNNKENKRNFFEEVKEGAWIFSHDVDLKIEKTEWKNSYFMQTILVFQTYQILKGRDLSNDVTIENGFGSFEKKYLMENYTEKEDLEVDNALNEIFKEDIQAIAENIKEEEFFNLFEEEDTKESGGDNE